MNSKNLKNTAIYNVLKRDKKAQQAFVRMGKTEDWRTLKIFVSELKQLLLEKTLEVDSLEEIRRYKHLIYAMESIVFLPQLVGDIKELGREDLKTKEDLAEDARRRKFNPGGYLKRMFEGNTKSTS